MAAVVKWGPWQMFEKQFACMDAVLVEVPRRSRGATLGTATIFILSTVHYAKNQGF